MNVNKNINNMIEQTTYIKCRPSQLANLDNFLLVLILIPALFLMDELIRGYLPIGFIPEKLEPHILLLPVYLFSSCRAKPGVPHSAGSVYPL